jgi:hypothetical protein
MKHRLIEHTGPPLGTEPIPATVTQCTELVDNPQPGHNSSYTASCTE